MTEIDGEQDWIEDEKRMDCFRLTVSKTIDFNKNHPYFNDNIFLSELIIAFEIQEDFEACATLSGFLSE